MLSHFLNPPTTNQENITGSFLFSLYTFSGANLIIFRTLSIKMIGNNINQMDEQGMPERLIFFLYSLVETFLFKSFTTVHTSQF